MALTKVTSGVRTLGTGEVATANMAVDPTNADNLSSGDVPLAQLGNVPATDLTGLEDDIALLGFRVAANGSLAKYNLVDQTIDAFEDASGIDASASTNEGRNASNYYSGLTDNQTEITADGDFITSAALTGTADVLVVAGGGGAGKMGTNTGAGGAGGLVYVDNYALAASTTYAVTVGAGGAIQSSYAIGNQGIDSVFDTGGVEETLTAKGGGAGNSHEYSGSLDPLVNGGSGGGGAGDYYGAQGTLGGSSTQAVSFGSYTNVGFGYAGGVGANTNVGYARPTGGGGGAGSIGASFSTSTPGNGGSGKDYSSVFGTGVGDSGWFSGGGGGRGNSTQAYGNGGSGNYGGGGDSLAAAGPGESGTANTGGGAGAGSGDQNGAAGGSGVIVVKYQEIGDMTLVSNAQTAQSAPTKGDIVLTYTNGAGSTTLGDDLTAEYSADGGSTWTSMTLASEGSTGSHNIATAHDVALTSTSGTSMAYRIKTLNQSASKSTRIHAVSLGWS